MRVVQVVGLIVTLALVGRTSAVPAAHTSASTFGINCEGSLKCHGQPGDTAKQLVGYIESLDPARVYTNGQHIACRYNICAFLQGEPAPMSGAAIRNVAHLIVEHGCTVCGSVPTSAGNDDAYGELTFNFVNDASCGEGGVC
ncbi:Kp4-domain-containing protein [Mycena polygramma]|nr:Kp4-domain-containing protein [Mycena polygramma]